MTYKKDDIIRVHLWEELVKLSVHDGVDKDGDLLFEGVFFIEEMKKTCGQSGKIRLVEDYQKLPLYTIDFITPLKSTCYFTEEMFQPPGEQLKVPTNEFNEELL